ncbi:hypothetical protein F2P56_020809, partial [Juglans regia]
SSIPTKSQLAVYPFRTLLMAFATMILIASNIGTDPIAATLSLFALSPTSSAVVPIAKNVPAMLLAAVEQAGPVVCWYSIAHIVCDGMTPSTFLYHAGQEPASR